jgi:predicted glycoside hydrolase/deacetylase ChbG (UPF0249 family)
MSKHLIVNADDFGMSPGVSQGILEAHLNGIVTSTSVMINMPTAPDSIAQAKRLAPRLGLGLHFTLSLGRPVSDPADVPSLVGDDGRFVSTLGALVDRMPRFTAEDLRREMTAQFERFVQVVGTLPDHLDSHHGSTYYQPAALAVMLALAAQHKLPIRNGEDFLNVSTLLGWGITTEAERATAIIRALRDTYRAHPAPLAPEPFEPDPAFYNTGATFDNMLAILAKVPTGVVELGCHPGYAHDLDEAYSAPREQERLVMIDMRVRTAIDKHGITLAKFSDLPRLRPSSP